MLRKALVALLVAGVITGPFSQPARAGCHAFTFDRDEYTVEEGTRRVTITVSRDNVIAPSSIKYRTVNGTAKAGEDYTAKSGTLSYTTQRQMSFSVRILDDAEHEPRQSFRVRLHDPSGCAPNPNYVVDDPATVAIRDDDPETAMTQTPSPTATGTTDAATASPSPTATGTPDASPSPTTTAPTADGGLSPGAIAGIIAAAVVVLGGAALVLRRRSGA